MESNTGDIYIGLERELYKYSHPRFKGARVKSTPRVKDEFFFRIMVPRDFKNIGGWSVYLAPPPKIHAGRPLSTESRERSAAAPAVCGYSMRRFLPTAGVSSASGTKPCEEPTCAAPGPVGPVLQCPCGRWLHGFCGRVIGEEGYGQQRECTDCQKITPRGGGRPEPCITSSITEAEVHSRFEEIRSYLYAKGRDSEYSETQQYLLSKAVHSFIHET